MPRYRIFYEKRGPACFVPHIVLPTVFTRAAARASHAPGGGGSEPIIFQLTEGFSPHAKMSFASELPVGVVALREPVDMWFVNELSDSQFAAWSESLPTGFKLVALEKIADGSPSLSKSCPISEYLLKARSAEITDLIMNRLLADNQLMSCSGDGEFIRFTVNNNELTLGAVVRKLISENIVEGWHELCIVRIGVIPI